MFSKSSLFSGLLLFAAVFGSAFWLKSAELSGYGPTRQAAAQFIPVRFDAPGFAPLHLAGAWQVRVEDPRFGGVSALAVEGDALLALTDSGSLIRLPKPGGSQNAVVADLPAGPGQAPLKVNRDSEALARDPGGRGWWVAFEQWHQLWLFDPAFRRPLARIDLGRDRWSHNRGVEAMVAGRGSLLLFPESGVEWLSVRGGRIENHSLDNDGGSIADGVRLRDGRLLLVTRQFGLPGITKRLVVIEKGRQRRLALRPFAALPLGATANVEAIAAEPRTGGGTRLWLMTDNDFRPRAPTLLVALDLP